MTTILNKDLPDELKSFKVKIESTIKPYIEIKATKNEKLNLWQSKFGGFPYFPKAFPYPLDSKKQPMFLLAQINFDEVPGLFPFPNAGLLQFYIAGNDDHCGMNFKDLTLQKNFRVLFFPTAIQNEADLIGNFDFLPNFEFTPFRGSYSLEFNLQEESIPTVDYLFDQKILDTDLQNDEKRYQIYDKYDELFPSQGHKMGGYPFFTQHDPRAEDQYKNENFTLLFQMDTDGDNDIMWGDAGVGNFFIREKDLQERNFSKILYYWDCC